jgi:hypothetical protein
MTVASVYRNASPTLQMTYSVLVVTMISNAKKAARRSTRGPLLTELASPLSMTVKATLQCLE